MSIEMSSDPSSRARRASGSPHDAGAPATYPATVAHLILLEFSPDDECAVAVRFRAELLDAAHAVQPLWTAAFRHDDVDFQAVANLRRRRVSLACKCADVIEKRTSMWRSVALVNESITMASTSGRGRCVGCDWPTAAVWFLKYICKMYDNG